MRLYIDVARLQSFSEAAKLHDISQSAASQRIKELERKLDTTLVNRKVRPLELTDAGERFYRGCLDIIERYDRLIAQTQTIGGVYDLTPSMNAANGTSTQADHGTGQHGESPANLIQGHVHVAAIYSSGIALLNRVRETFEEDYPLIDVEITYRKPGEVYRMVRDRDADIGMVSYPKRLQYVHSLPLRDEQMVVVCNPQHALARFGRDQGGPGQLDVHELSNHRLINFDQDLPASRQIEQFLRDHGCQVAVAERFDNIDTIKNAVASMDHYAILPLRTVLREMQSGMLVTIQLRPILTRPIGIIMRERGSGLNGQQNGNGNGNTHANGTDYGHESSLIQEHLKLPNTVSPAAAVFVKHLLQFAGPTVNINVPQSGERVTGDRVTGDSLTGNRLKRTDPESALAYGLPPAEISKTIS